jgi:hypothetical protein
VACLAALPDKNTDMIMTISDGESPVATCARDWANGDILGDPHGHHHVPPLVACVTDKGLVEVIPTPAAPHWDWPSCRPDTPRPPGRQLLSAIT